MAPSRSFRTYSKGNTSVSAMDAFNILFAKNLTQRKLHGKKLKAKKLEIKELPQKIKTILSDDSLRVNINDTFDKILQPQAKALPSSYNNSLDEAQNSLLVYKKADKSSSVNKSSFDCIKNASPMVKKLRSFKNNSSNINQKYSWFDQTTPTGEAITNSLEVELSSSSVKRHNRKSKNNSNASRSSLVCLRSQAKDTSSINASKDLSNKNSSTVDDFKNPNDLLPANMSISVIAKNNSLLNPFYQNSMKENGLVHSSTPLVSKKGPRMLVQPISPINTQSNSQDKLESYIMESLEDIRSWNLSLPPIDTGKSETVKVAQENLPQKQMSFDLHEFEKVFTQLSSIYKQQHNTQAKTRSFSLEHFEKFHKTIIEGEKRLITKNSKNISLSDFESFCESYLKTVDKESFFDSSHRSGFVTHRKHKNYRHQHKKHFTLKDLVVVLDKNILNMSRNNFMKHKEISYPKYNTLKQLTVNVTKLSLKSPKIKSKPAFKAKDKLKRKRYAACKKFTSNWNKSSSSMTTNASINDSKKLMKSAKMTTGTNAKRASKTAIIPTSSEKNQDSNARKTRSQSKISDQHTSNSSSAEKPYVSQILSNTILDESQKLSSIVSPYAFINRRRPGVCRNQNLERDKSEKNYIAQDYSNILFKTPEKKINELTRKTTLSVSPDLFDSFVSNNGIKRPHTRSQSASNLTTESNSVLKLTQISNSSKIKTKRNSVFYISDNIEHSTRISDASTGISDASNIMDMSGNPSIQSQIQIFINSQSSQLSIPFNADDSQKVTRTSMQTRKSNASKKLFVAETNGYEDGRISRSLQENLVFSTPCRRYTDATDKNRKNGRLRSEKTSTTDSCYQSDSHRATRSLSVYDKKNIPYPVLGRNFSGCRLSLTTLTKNSMYDSCFESDSHRLTRSMSSSCINFNKELIIMVGTPAEKNSISNCQTLSPSTETPQKRITRTRKSNCYSIDKELIILVDSADSTPSCVDLRKSSLMNNETSINCTIRTLRQSSRRSGSLSLEPSVSYFELSSDDGSGRFEDLIDDQISIKSTRTSRKSSRSSGLVSFQLNSSDIESSSSTLQNDSLAPPALNETSKTDQNQKVSNTLPDCRQSDEVFDRELRSDTALNPVFKIPTLPGFKPKHGKCWRRSLMQQKRESLLGRNARESIVDTTVNSPQNSIGKGTPSTGSYNSRMSIKILPAYSETRTRRRTALQSYVYSEVLSQDVTNNISLPKKLSLPIVTARDIVLKYCNQVEPIPFEQAYPRRLLRNCKKIGEGVYGEVFLYTQPNGISTVMKVIPIEGNQIINGERQKEFHEILSEIAIVSELSNLKNNINNSTSGFCEVQRITCVKGKYPKILIDHWEEYDENKGSENDPPDIFKEDQLYVVLDLGNGGQDLEAFVFNNASQAVSMFKQVCYTLAIAEEELQFEHRDLHWGNVLLRKVNTCKKINFKHKGKVKSLKTEGVQVTIIDFTLSRMTHDDVVIFNDLGQDPDLFQAEGDYQFEIYRLMKERNCNDWQKFTPYTNVLWLHYILDKSITALRYNNKMTRSHKQGIQILKDFKECLLKYNSATEFVRECL
ncbi:uncharacterized protein LOC126741126 [Anthonomus grandis grandis]|uniref:uncharacterized protein LOC126741126 n=1 Tax=Anthonomus grandis grandis TaxID=2921223 RepID=UPI0021652AA9|nr:uncharacterized protein LOC126741126 [Anthonomus grandis grandis]